MSPKPDPFPTDMPSKRVQEWIQTIREIYETSNRTEIRAFREKYKGKKDVKVEADAPAFK
jgi:hypothetical protein